MDEKTESAAFVVHGGTIMAALSQLAGEPYDFITGRRKTERDIQQK